MRSYASSKSPESLDWSSSKNGLSARPKDLGPHRSITTVASRAAAPGASTLTEGDVLYLQRTIGNRRVGELLRYSTTAMSATGQDVVFAARQSALHTESDLREELGEMPAGNTSLRVAPRPQLNLSSAPAWVSPVQRKTTISSPADAAEREADEVAGKMIGITEPLPRRSIVEPMKRGAGYKDEGPTIQTQFRHSVDREGALHIETAVSAAERGGMPLPRDVRSYFEPRLGYDFSQVRVHADAEAADGARAVRARAYTIGRDIVFGAGQYAPATVEGKRVLAHELVHVVQQAGGTAAAQGAPAVQRVEPEYVNVARAVPISSSHKPLELQRVSWEDVGSVLEWTNPLTFSGKLIQTAFGVEPNLWTVAEQFVRQSATKITMPPRHIKNLVRYARAVPDDGWILMNALAQDPSFYKGGWLLSANSAATAMTFGNSIFFRQSPPSVETFIHEMVHIYQYAKLGRGPFLLSYFGLSLATIIKRFVSGEPLEVMESSPHEKDAYALERRFTTWLAAHP